MCYGLINYSKGIKEGVSVEYYNSSNGKIRSVGNYKGGKEHGSWFFFSYDNPPNVVEIKYDNGEIIDN